MTISYAIKAAAIFAVTMGIAWRGRRTHHPFPRFGSANQITTLRALIVAAIAGLIGEPHAWASAGVAVAGALLATVLDGVDGWLARRTKTVSAFGARFDMEIDALLIQVLAILAWRWHKAGAWVLASGLMRYAFVAASWPMPWLGRPLPGTARGKLVCIVQIAALTIAVAPFVTYPASAITAAVGLIALTYSFAVDVEWLWNPRSRWVPLAFALVFLNAALTFGNVWPTPAIRWQTQLSVELALAILAVAAGARSVRARNIAAAVLGAGWMLLILGRYAEVTAPALYGRDVNLYWDLRLMPDVASMIARVASWWQIVAVVVGVAALILAAFVVLRAAWRRVAAALGDPRERRPLVAFAALVVAAFVVDLSAGGFHEPAPGEDERIQFFAWPVSATYIHQARLVAAAMAGTRSLPPSPEMRSDFSGIAGADVLLIFVESYGAVTFDRPEFAAGLAPSRRAFDADIVGTGRRVVSAAVESPTFGGGSWLAHVSLLSGVEVRDPDTNALLMTERRDTLVTAFHRGGFRTVALMPGLRQSWPEGRFYGFDEIYGAGRLAYSGPEFGWFAIPDQFSLERLDALEIRRASRPLFVFFPTISTHFPFVPTPPYQPDWSRMTDARPYDGPAIVRAYRNPDWTDFGPGYIEAMSYIYATIGGFLRLESQRDLVLNVLGDHEPAAAVSGRGASWNVPVHVIASRGAVLDHLIRRGFRPGLTPARESIGRMHALTPILLEAFGDKTDGHHAP